MRGGSNLLKILTTPRRNRVVNFMYAEQYKDSGSTIMRGKQLSDILDAHTNLEVHYISTNVSPKNTTIVLTKGALLVIPEERLEDLVKKGNRLLYDPVDMQVPAHSKIYASGLIAASHSAFLEYKRTHTNIKINQVDHHADPRIKPVLKPVDYFSIAYFGEPQNAVFTPEIKKNLTVVPTSTTTQTTAWFDELPKYSAHYAFRKYQDFDGIKPFTKGFTAAKCQANILVQNDSETTHWLTESYPYMIDSDSSTQEIIRAINQMRASYGSPEWRQGLEIMQHVNQAVSPKKIALQLLEAIS